LQQIKVILFILQMRKMGFRKSEGLAQFQVRDRAEAGARFSESKCRFFLVPPRRSIHLKQKGIGLTLTSTPIHVPEKVFVCGHVFQDIHKERLERQAGSR
jgi:hypothetical protein